MTFYYTIFALQEGQYMQFILKRGRIIKRNVLNARPNNNNYLLYEGESKCGGVKLPKCTKCFTLGTSGFNLKPELSEAKRGL